MTYSTHFTEAECKRRSDDLIELRLTNSGIEVALLECSDTTARRLGEAIETQRLRDRLAAEAKARD